MYKILISGGGTGGHIFPAISIANAIKALYPQSEILFVGAENRMEMERVPAAGYRIVGLPVSGIDRRNPFRNIKVGIDLLRSLRQAYRLVRKFRPDIAIGVGGYASGPTLWSASMQGIPTLIQEQNSYAGVTNKLLSKRAKAICVAYQGMERFFPQAKIICTGNPIREELLNDTITPEQAREALGLAPDKKTLLVIGGSLGARTINQSIATFIEAIPNDTQLLWQTGKSYAQTAQESLRQKGITNVIATPFIARMDCAYRAADLVISRSGASSISELQLLGKPVILVPSPNVAEDHQRRNAEALSTIGAAEMIEDNKATQSLMPTALKLIKSKKRLKDLSDNIHRMALTQSAQRIAQIAVDIIETHKNSQKQ